MILRDRAMNLPGKAVESNWTGLMAGFVFQDINDQASEWVGLFAMKI